MKRWLRLVILFASIVGLAACAAETSPQATSQTLADPAGPALIMFYTDN